MNSGELDDQQHFREDLTKLLIDAISAAAGTFENREATDMNNEVNYEEYIE